MTKITETIKKWITLWPDIWAAPMILVGIWASYYILYFVDPTIGTFDLGILQALLFTVAVIVTINTVVFLGIEQNDKPLWSFYKKEQLEESEFNQLTVWQKTLVLYFWRAVLFSLGVVIFVNLI
jgi:hypothetical protein